MKTVLVLPGSFWQIPLVKKIKGLGHRVLVVNPYDNSPCFEFADDYLKSDIFDFERVLEYAKENNVDAVMSDECDIAMPLIAKLSDCLGLRSLSKETASVYTDKFLMREFCKKNGINFPEYRLCKTANDAVELLEELGRPIIIKPLDSNASHGVFKVSTREEIEEHFAESLSFSRVKKAVLAERFIEGTEFTMDGIKTPSSHFTLAISKKDHFKHNRNIANELLFSHSSDEFDYEKLKAINDSFVMKSPLEFGFTHAEYKCENGKFYLIEIGARGGGNMISSVITQFMSGYDTYKYLINSTLYGAEDADFSIKDGYSDRAAVLKFFKTPNGGGKVKSVKGLDVLENEPDIKEFMVYFKVGDVIEDCVSDSARIGFFIACSKDMKTLREVISKVENSFSIELE